MMASRESVPPRKGARVRRRQIPDNLRTKPAQPEIKGNVIKAAVRVRPLLGRELYVKSIYSTVSVKGNDITLKYIADDTELSKKYSLDHVFYYADQENKRYVSQQDVFEALGVPLVTKMFAGYNVCLLAYGQTGSGKSFSMMGPSDQLADEELVGIIPRFCDSILKGMEELPEGVSTSVKMSYYEIYKEKVYDLFSDKRKSLQVCGTKVIDLLSLPLISAPQVCYLLEEAYNRRIKDSTACENSRSHTIFSLTVTMRGPHHKRTSKVNLVELAGSERYLSTEDININLSLLTLRKVMVALKNSVSQHEVPYQDSVLTKLLQDNLGGNSFTTMLATITPVNRHLKESMATLRYAVLIRSVTNHAHGNEESTESVMCNARANLPGPATSATDEAEVVPEQFAEKKELPDTELQFEQNLAEVRVKEMEESEMPYMNQPAESFIQHYMSALAEKVEALSLLKDPTLLKLQSIVLVQNSTNWCLEHSLFYTFYTEYDSDDVLVKDILTNRQGKCSRALLHSISDYNDSPDNFVQEIQWEQPADNLTAVKHYMTGMQQLYSQMQYLMSKNSDKIDKSQFDKVDMIGASLQDFREKFDNIPR